MPTFDFMKQFSMFATLAAASGGSVSLGDSKRRMNPSIINTIQDYVIQQ